MKPTPTSRKAGQALPGGETRLFTFYLYIISSAFQLHCQLEDNPTTNQKPQTKNLYSPTQANT